MVSELIEQLFLPCKPPPTGDGFFYRNLVSGAETSVEARFREAEEELEQGRFQECDDKVTGFHSSQGEAGETADAMRLLCHSFRCSGKSHAALQHASEQWHLASRLEDPQAASKLQLSMAEANLALGDAQEALQLASKALDAFRNHDLPSYEGFCLLVMASATPDVSRAEEWCHQAIEVFQVDGHSHGLGRALLQLGTLASAKKALEIFKFCGDVRWQAYTLQKMALLHWNEDDPENAMKNAEASMSLLENDLPPDLPREASIAELLCAAHVRLGQPEVALRAVRICLSSARAQGDRSIEAHMLHAAIGATEVLERGLGGVMKTAATCRGIFDELGDRRMEAAALRTQCKLFLKGENFKDALAVAQEALRKALELQEATVGLRHGCPDPQAALCSSALLLCLVRSSRREPRAALEVLQRASRDMAEGTPGVRRQYLLKLKIQEAKVLMELEDYTAAGHMMFEAHKDCRQHGDWKGEASALMMLSRVQLERGKFAEALRAAEQASQLYRCGQDRLAEADALLLLSQAARSSVLSSSPEQRFVPDFIPGMQAAKDALAIAQHLGEKLLMAFAHLALAHLQVLSKDFITTAWEHAVQAAEIFAYAGLAENLAWSLEVQGFALYNLGYRDDAVEAIEKAKAAFQQLGPSRESHLGRCDATLKQMQEKRTVETETEPKKEPLALRMPSVLETQPAAPRARREVQDLSMLKGPELIQAQLTRIMEDLGADEVELDQGLQSAGLTSRAAVQMRSELEQTFGDLRYPATLAFDYPSIREMSTWLMDAQLKMAG